MPVKPAPSRFGILHGVTKIVAITVGLFLSVLCLMAVVGILTDNGWARVLIASIVAVVLPLVVADRVLPANDPASAKGLVSDVLALIWLGFPTLFIIAANGVTRDVMLHEGDRLMQSGWSTTGHLTYLLAGVLAVEVPKLGPAPEASSASSASATAPVGSAPPAVGSTSAPLGSAGAEASAAPPASAPPAPLDAGPGDKSPAELFKLLAPSVVSVTTKSGAMEGGGTGFLIDKDGTIATNHHVIEDAQSVRVKFMNDTTFDQVELLADDKSLDLALLKVDLSHGGDGGSALDVPPVELGDSDSVVVGERAISIGNPLGLEHTLTDGLVSARRMYEGRAWIQMSVPVSPGNSGGPLFNMRGQVIGVTTAQVAAGMFGRAQNLNLAVPVNVLKTMIRPDYPQRRKFGAGSGSGQW